MLRSLHIENIAVIKSVSLDFTDGFTAMTGETGAGKSIIIDSINLLLGAKADKELVRNGENSATVSALFTDLSDATVEMCNSLGLSLDDDKNLLVQRTIAIEGSSHVRINGKISSLSILKAMAPSLISIHGQSDTGTLLDTEKHIELIDVYASNDKKLSEYRALYAKLEKIRREIQDIVRKDSERERLKEILAYQIKDIDSMKLHDGEEEDLIDRKVKIKNSEKISKNSEFVYKALKGSEKGSVAFLLDRSATALSQLGGVIPEYESYAERIRDVLYQVEDVAEEVYAVLETVESDPTSVLNGIESRLDKISKMKRKYGLTIKDVLEFRNKAKAELDTLENFEETLKTLRSEEEKAYLSAIAVAEELHSARVTAAKQLERETCEILKFLDMPNVVFFAKMSEEYSEDKKELNNNGYDKIEFYISANKGADAQSLSRIASGGELARVMLALKSLIAGKDGVSSVIFDEIDAGVSGKTARKIGMKMRDISSGLQVFCVTHSAQIASLGDVHFLISKSDANGTTETSVTSLDYNGRVRELSRILGGINVTDAQRAAAVDMLNEREFR